MFEEKPKRYSVLFLALITACSLTFFTNADFVCAKPKLKKIAFSSKTITMTVGSKKTLTKEEEALLHKEGEIRITKSLPLPDDHRLLLTLPAQSLVLISVRPA